MDLPVDQVRTALENAAPERKAVTIAFTGRAGTHRAVVVERKPSRRLAPGRRFG